MSLRHKHCQTNEITARKNPTHAKGRLEWGTDLPLQLLSCSVPAAGDRSHPWDGRPGLARSLAIGDARARGRFTARDEIQCAERSGCLPKDTNMVAGKKRLRVAQRKARRSMLRLYTIMR